MSDDGASITGEGYDFEACATCGTPFDPDVRYPVRTTEDDDGSLQIHSFCDKACLEEWFE